MPILKAGPLSGARVVRARGKPLTEDEIQRIKILLEDTDLPMPMIAKRMHCTRSSISRINKEFQIRSSNGQRKNWVLNNAGGKAGEGVNG